MGRSNKSTSNKLTDIAIINNLNKTFVSYERGDGFLEAIRSLFIRKQKIFKAVDNISFSIARGEIVGFLGPNGAGKSTTIKILSGIMFPDDGIVNILNYVPWKDRKRYVREIGVVFGQKSQLFWDLPPIDAFYLNKSIYSIPKKTFDKNLKMLTRLLDIKDIQKRPARQLSLGERMRCEFVMAMLHSPKIVFLDEPTIGLDVFAKDIIRNFIIRANKQFGTTFIITSHDLVDIERMCERVIIINHGKIVYDNSLKNLKTNDSKIIKVRFKRKINYSRMSRLKDIRIIKHDDFNAILKANTKGITIDKLIKKIRMDNKIDDLDISNPPIEDIIKKIYNKKPKRKSV